MSLTKKIRFEVFKRDGFKCQYCGQTPPAITLEVDHINPVSKGGEDDINNLVTSCFDCNRGKSNVELSKIPNTLQQNKDILEERENQYVEYYKLLAKIERRKQKELDQINAIYAESFDGWELKDRFLKTSVKMFIEKLGIEDVKNSMYYACNKIYDRDKAIRYFCGICWNKINSKNI